MHLKSLVLLMVKHKQYEEICFFFYYYYFMLTCFDARWKSEVKLHKVRLF